MNIRWTGSADKHGVSREDAVNAMLRHQFRISPFGSSRVPGRAAPDLFIGPGLDGRLLEVMAEVADGRLVVFHVMDARPKILEAARRAQ
ncbi:hypothetical protein KQI48_09820 [Cellulomonas hominis]|jgi:hypothetical protein|uniref:hypothetical protein n=1 Tax=Cellulomonas hominis TaxID=156981 RepID=UPI00144391E5|nr:hypothetical protein [Cellulomonas hominis]MBU5422962.1 hypothetical protein [Cellulomonas hominis]NKY09996.1 hypothetical protein [Cellulomonas hominis]